MSGLLHFNSQPWKLWYDEGMSFCLPRSNNPDRIYLNCGWTFVRPEVVPEEISTTPELFRVHLICPVFGLHDWRDLAECPLDLYLEDSDYCSGGPDLFVHPPDAAKNQRPDGWDTQLTFSDRNGFEFEFEMEASRYSQRADEAHRELQVSRLLKKNLPPDWEGRDWLDEGDTLSFSGRIRLTELLCHVPINAKEPVEWARQLARKELKVDKFGTCRVNGADWQSGKFKPQDGVGSEGRLVVVGFPDEPGDD